MDKFYKKLDFSEIMVFSPKIHSDKRGIFFENLNFNKLSTCCGFKFKTIQENISISHKNVIRGLHFQKGENVQKKIISVMSGSIIDVIVDIRPNSTNFGKWINYLIDDKKNESIFIPAGFAHGFLTLSDCTKISYKVDKPYDRISECSIKWNDKSIGINWPVKFPILSEKDKESLGFEENLNLKNFDSFSKFI